MRGAENIYEYTDYREFLSFLYHLNKKEDAQFSHRVMARALGFTSPNFLKLVIDKERHIGKGSVDKIVSGLRLSKKESEYFSYCVFFAKAKTTVEKNYYYGLIAGLRANKVISPLPAYQFEFYNNWYTAIVRELVNNQPVECNYAALAKKIIPPILPKQVKKSIQLLEKLKLIRRTKDGRFVHASPILNTDKEVQSLALKNFHRTMIELGGEAIDQFTSENREISSCTVKISQQGFARIKSRIQEFREEILQIVKDDRDVDRVAQVNFQFFPLTHDGHKDIKEE